MTSTSDENTYPLLNEATFKKGTPDILIVIMESFASELAQEDFNVFLDLASRLGYKVVKL